MEQSEKLLKDYSDMEKGAYLGAIASIATADHSATEEEVEALRELCASADLSTEQEESVVMAAQDISGDDLKRSLDVIKQSDLRFSLVTDLISFAESDQSYSAEEKSHVEKIAQYLNINQSQFSALNQFVQKTSSSNIDHEEVSKPGFLSSLGLDNTFKSAGLNMGSLTKGLLGIAGPMILAKMLSGGMGRNRGGMGGGLGGLLGGGLGGLLGGGGMMGGGGLGGMMGGRSSSGGLGSLISVLNGGRGFRNSGGLLSKILGRGF